MNQEFQTWLDTANVSALGVRRKKNEDEIGVLLAETNADGTPRIPTSDQLSKAEVLHAENTSIIERSELLKKAVTIRQQTLANRPSPMPVGNGGNQGDEPRISFPKSIGTLTSFVGDREVLRKNGRTEKMSAERRAYELGTFIFGAVAGNEVTRQAFRNKAGEMGYEYLTMNEGSVGAGGYLVPPEFSADFIYLQQQYGIARKYCRNMAVSSNDFRQPRMASGTTVAWEGELSSITPGGMTIDQVQVLLKRISSLNYVSNELNADSIIGIMEWLVKDSVRQMGQKEDDAFFNGDGTAAYGNTVGVIPGLTAIASNAGVVLQGTGSTWAAITNADIENLMGSLPEFPGMNPKFFCSKKFYHKVLRTLLVNLGGTNLQMVAAGLAPKQYDGNEVVVSQVMPTNVAPSSGTISLLYGDPEYSSTFVSKGEYTVFQANQGDTNMSTNTTTIRIDERVGIVNHELGSSTLAGAMVGLQAN